jgi:hypothetical protein
MPKSEREKLMEARIDFSFDQSMMKWFDKHVLQRRWH